jgi:putative ABC transport system ATP-binding protein
MTTLAVKDLTVEYVSAGYRIRPIENLSFKAENGQLVVLLGPSGCGKSTLLSCIAGLLTPTSGEITVNGIDVGRLRGARRSSYRRDTVGVIFQAFNLIPSLSAQANVTVPLRLAGMTRSAARERARELLQLVGLGERAHHRPGQLSGGQQQRVAIARALALDPPLVIADEPTAHLDSIQVEGVLRLIRDIAAAGRLVIIATHDDRITQIADQVVDLVQHRREIAYGPRRVHVAAGKVIFHQGDASDRVYIVESGTVEIFRELADGTEEHLTEIPAGRYFGELGPLLDLPRSATARATTDVELTGYGVNDFRARFLPSGPRPGGLP